MKATQLSIGALAILLALTAASLAQTKIIDNGPDGAKKVLVVMGDGYAAGADQTTFNNDVDNLLVRGVFGNDFFRENQNAFNVYRLNLISAESGVSQRVYDEQGTPSDPSDDTVVSTTMRDTALRYIWSGSWAHCWLEASAETDALLTAALAAVPKYDYVVVILNQNSFGGCGGGGFQLVPRGVTWPVLAHEFGHGIGGLADEYFNAGTSYTGGTVNGPNCSTVLDRSTVHWNRFISPATDLPTLFGTGMNSNHTVGMFEGCATSATGIYRPVHNCRMNGNVPLFCPVCYTHMKKALYLYLDHNFGNAIAGDFTGEDHSDILMHNGQDLAIYHTRTTSYELDLAWTANNIVPAASGGATWEPATHDQYFIADFDGDGKDDIVVFNGTDWVIPYLALLRSDGIGLQGVARYDGSIPGFWTMSSSDEFFVGDFNGDGKDDLFVFNGTNELGLLESNGAFLSGTVRYEGSIPGWSIRSGDQYFVGDFDGDGKTDLYVFNGTSWGSSKYLAMLKSSGTGLLGTSLFTNSLPGWSMSAGDQFYVGDFDGDDLSDLYVFNGTNWSHAYLLMAKSTGTSLSFVHRYDSSSTVANIPGWLMTAGDRFFISDANKDGKDDLFVYNPAINWGTEYLGTLMSSGTALSGSWSDNWVGGWNLGAGDEILVVNYEGDAGKADIFIRNHEWFGLLRRASSGFEMDRIYYHWIYTALYDATPWSDSMP